MITKSDSSEVLGVAVSLQNICQLIEEDLERELLRAGADVVVVVIHRIKREGKDALGGTLDTKSASRSGAYSKRYAGIRKEAGRQTSQVDLNMTGKMLLDYNLTERSKTAVGVGFMSDESDEKAGYLEEYYGAEIFVPSEQEEDDIMEDAMSRVERLIDRL
ncbi:hypothetical protein [Dyadobacter sp. CY347]|uniref:hypothetical protein n=1 Tax=Dyadobacter sp. CY347 TaxID=2909336 RepID=UPI001F163C04|nr:hypothetical protein [Dyadobacter sp. CY347]MCF2487456.1 hypothetical protein [Dyadobacter sp. CY347]